MSVNEPTYHVPVLLEPSVNGLNIQPQGIYVDATMGGGGHTRLILERMGPEARLLGFDQDLDALRNVPDDKRFTFVHSNFRYLHNFLRYYGVDSVDGILADLGVSSHHLDDPGRGFSFRFDGKLDMRMNQSATLNAAEVLNNYNTDRLADILYLYGELKNSRKLAEAIARERDKRRIDDIAQLRDIVLQMAARGHERKLMARVFQALRMEVNHEMDALQTLLTTAVKVLKPGGRLVVITYHSLEDRMVKNMMRTGNVYGTCTKDVYGRTHTPLKPVNNKVVVADDKERTQNPRARSAKLRIAERKGGEDER